MSTETNPAESTQALVPAAVSTVTVVDAKTDADLSALTPVEMLQCQTTLIEWCKRKIAVTCTERDELEGAYKHAVAHKWKSGTLKRHWELAAKRVEYYKKMLTALEAGYYIVPNFPVTLFAIRTDRKKPARIIRTESYVPNLSQDARTLPVGKGEYKNPVPTLRQSEQFKDQHGRTVRNYWADKWDELEFPANMAKLHIMEATTKAMQLKVFDELGMLPADRQRHPDPILVGHIIDPRPVGYGPPKYITFMIAWHLDTRTL